MPDLRIQGGLKTIAQIVSARASVIKEGSTSQAGIREILMQCGEEGVAASIAYMDIGGIGGHRDIDPYEFEVTGGHSGRRSSEKLWAHCHQHGETHSFIMARIFWAIKTDKRKIGGYPYIMKGISKKKSSQMTGEEKWQKTVEELSQQPMNLGGEGEAPDVGPFPGYRSEND
jgi:hypothetical protein